MTQFVQPLVVGQERTRSSVLQKYTKMKNSMRYWLLAKLEDDPKMLMAYQAFERLIAKEFDEHGNLRMRKDGITPEVMHQLRIAHHVKSLWKYLLYPIETFVAACEHDSMEDDGVLYAQMKKQYGKRTAEAIQRLSKKFQVDIEPVGTEVRVQVEMLSLFKSMAECPISSVLKLLDRIDNIRYMLGVFSRAKQRSYIQEVFVWFLPMAKKARLSIPQQEPVYELLKRQLMDLCDVYTGNLDDLDAADSKVQALEAKVAELQAQLTSASLPLIVNDSLPTA